ncbi:MAG: bifunctional (p)ppGpp synthetase/guanosine-3',5'-bis(diphosphate) 3'-pyrophosphohydrolase [candidate division Zixibacteria bacterium]|nr:bifunctional (p)ppGpp synthetase/guanosine-3',5'-bis(diphosphate) 3'-pyrophosphohydrolase [candidate division Zixibacteria bacterium]
MRPALHNEHESENLNLAEFVIRIEAFNANINIPLIRRAYEFSDRAHAGQLRESGVPYIDHCREVALILAEWHMDSATIAAGLMHDAVEDTGIEIEDIAREFDKEIANLVDGVTKISSVRFRSREERQVDYFRKMLLSVARDIRIILIKLADRVHNMRTLSSLPREKQTRIAQETRDIYAPLANRFGIAKAKVVLEDLSFKYLEPERYQELAGRLDSTRAEREKFISEITGPIREALSRERIKAEVSGRAKHLDSINRKIRVRGVPFESIYDLSAIRVIVGSVHECYHVLGVIHAMWKPAPDRFHDYIANPKPNGYQSLHTTVIGPEARLVEIQIRTHQMHYIAQNGIAAHWLYKEGKKELHKTDQQMVWLRDVLEWQKDMKNPAEFLEYLKIDLFPHDVYVFTPAGTIIHLPVGATSLDFAFAVHTEIGMHCVGAKINERIAPLSTRLKSGDVVEIRTNSSRTPSRDWLKMVVTSNARSRIKRWLKRSGHVQLVALGREMLDRELKKLKLAWPADKKLVEVAQGCSFQTAESLLASLGNGDISLGQVVNRITPQAPDAPPPAISDTVQSETSAKGIRIQGYDRMIFRFASCCQPIPGDEIVGFVTRGRGVTIHRLDCSNLSRMLLEDPERQIETTWDVSGGQTFTVRIEITVEDRKNILRDITQVIADSDAYLQGAEMHASESTAVGHFLISVNTLAHLQRLFEQIKRIPGVITVRRSQGAQGATGAAS